MAKGKGELEKLKKDPSVKAMGVTDIKRDGNQISLMIDPSKLSEPRRKALGAGLVKANATNTINNQPWDAPYFEGVTSNLAMFNTHDKMRIAMRYYKTDPLAGRIIDMLRTLTNDGFKNEHKNLKTKKIFDNWNKRIGMEQVLDWITLEYFRTGNVVTMRELGLFKPEDYELDYPLHSQASLLRANAEKKNAWSKKQIPIAYTVLNPLTVYVKELNGYIDNLYFATMQTTNKEIDGITQADPTAILLKQIPPDLKRRVELGKNLGELPLNEKNVKRILRFRQPYEAYGCILMERAFAALHEKNKMRMMDITMENAMINYFVKITVGNDQFPATGAMVRKIAEAFRNVGKSQMIFWNHTLNIEVIKPDMTVLDKKKYERVDEDIRNAFGISEVILGTGGTKTNFAIAYLSLKGFLTNIQDARREILRWVQAEYEDIGEALQLDSVPTPGFNPLSLTDEIAEKQTIMALLDRGVISYKTAQMIMGFDPEVEIQRRADEIPLIEDGVLGIIGSPYQQAATGPDAGGDSPKKSAPKKSNPTTEQEADTKQNEVETPKATTTGPDKPVQDKTPSGLGRKKTNKGNYPKSRKPAKGSIEDLEESEADNNLHPWEEKAEEENERFLAPQYPDVLLASKKIEEPKEDEKEEVKNKTKKAMAIAEEYLGKKKK